MKNTTVIFLLIPAISLADNSLCHERNDEFTCKVFTEGGLTIKSLLPSQKSIYATELDKLPTIIISSTDSKSLCAELAQSKEGAPYHKYLPLPNIEAIASNIDAPKTAKDLIETPNWRASNLRSITYHGNGGNEGPTLVCLTLELKKAGEHTAILQCNNFYKNDIKKLKELAKSLEDAK
ncbi:hypothetical protein HNP46_005846 [Pseudomonas nitritireducens]|uniref:Uncharacterized protein n=1 Tax=Pseudomonas nitroreducens TaxID=46680 RepID=A0A7W7KR30_PSENT|nr:hypothetical protein [Pseudomonas nitritireducens]MBB4866938.1 hypothetical protein [Pseudomonas nitritireducens]